jgi:hypothetical protein
LSLLSGADLSLLVGPPVSLSRVVANAVPKHNPEVNSKKTVVVIGKITDDTRYVTCSRKEFAYRR